MRVRLLLLTMLVAVIFYNMTDTRWQLRFDYSPLNYVAAAILALLLPALIVSVSLRIARRYLNLFGLIVAAIVTIPCGLFAGAALVEGSDIHNNIDGSLELLSQSELDAAHYRLYRTNCGATCAYGLVLRKEYDSPLGLKAVTELWSKYRASEGVVQIEGESMVRVLSGGNVVVTVQQ